MRKPRLHSMLLPVFLLLACGSTKAGEDPQERVHPSSPRHASQDEVKKAAQEDPDNALREQRSIYFDSDRYTVKAEYRPMLEAHARYLLANPGIKVYLNGYTDAHGSREYDLVIARKQADSVRAILAAYGVANTRMETVSYGSEKARTAGNDKAARAQNRRVDIDYGDR